VPDFNNAPYAGDNALSCVSPTFCVAIAGSGNAFIYDGTSWSKPVSLYSSSGEFESHISCASTTFCMVGAGQFGAFTYNGTSWSKTASIVGEPISCSSQRSAWQLPMTGLRLPMTGRRGLLLQPLNRQLSHCCLPYRV